MIELRKIDKDNYSECLNLQVSDEQKNFVASNTYSLAQAWVFFETAYPVAIYSDDIMVGFIMYGPENSDGGMFMHIDRFMIDKRFQGKGYGKLALAELIKRIKKDFNFKEIYLSYEPQNIISEKLYSSFGFVKTGEFSGNECIAVLKF